MIVRGSRREGGGGSRGPDPPPVNSNFFKFTLWNYQTYAPAPLPLGKLKYSPPRQTKITVGPPPPLKDFLDPRMNVKYVQRYDVLVDVVGMLSDTSVKYTANASSTVRQ